MLSFGFLYGCHSHTCIRSSFTTWSLARLGCLISRRVVILRDFGYRTNSEKREKVTVHVPETWFPENLYPLHYHNNDFLPSYAFIQSY
jgi:hypothetical protein